MERKNYLYNVDEKENFYKIDLSLFIISLLIVLSKVVIGYWSSLPSVFNSSYDISDNFFSSIYSSIIELWIPAEWIIKPILIGLMMSFITWQIIYLDSDMPGVRPPTPFTNNKYYYYKRSKSNYRYHLCYVFAMAVAPLTTVSLLITDYLQ